MAKIKPADLRVGDVFYECESGTNIEARVTQAPVATVTSLDNRTQWQWRAVNTQNGAEIEYLLTEGLEHYGPRLYTKPQYARWNCGEISYPLLGSTV